MTKTNKAAETKKNTKAAQPDLNTNTYPAKGTAAPFEKYYLTVVDIRSYLSISNAAAYELPPQGLPGLPLWLVHPHPGGRIPRMGG